MPSTPEVQLSHRHMLQDRVPFARWWLPLLLMFSFGAAEAQAPAPAPAPAAASAAEASGFDVLEFAVLGNTLLSTEIIERVLYPFLGPKRVLADVEAARAALEASYREAGYGTVLVDIPEQRVAGGLVTLQVVQAPVTRLRVTGAKYFSQGRILNQVPGLAEGKTPDLKQVGEQLANVNRVADRRVTPLLRPGKQPGTTEVDLTVEDRLPLHGSLEVSNRHTPDTTPTKLQASLRYDNLWQREHSIGMQAQISPENRDEVRVLATTYTMPMDNGVLIGSLVRSRSSTFVSIGDVQISGSGRIYSLRRVLIDGDESRTDSLTLGVDYKIVSSTQINLGPSNALPACGGSFVCNDLRYMPFSLAYSKSKTDKTGNWIGGGGFVVGLRGLVSHEEDFATKRYLATGNFSTLKFDLARTQNLPRDMTLYGKVEGQLASGPLIPEEQFVVGGVDSVRGYLDSAAAGDQGLRATIELRSGSLVSDKSPWFGGLRVHAFVDGAAVFTKQPLPEQDDREGLLSTGVGLRLLARRHATLGLDLAWPLHDAGRTDVGTLRLHATGLFEF